MYVCTETPPQAGLMFTYLPYIYYYTGRWKVVSDLGWCDCGDCFVTCGGSGTCLQLRYTFYVAYFNAEITSSLVHSSCTLNQSLWISLKKHSRYQEALLNPVQRTQEYHQEVLQPSQEASLKTFMMLRSNDIALKTKFQDA